MKALAFVLILMWISVGASSNPFSNIRTVAEMEKFINQLPLEIKIGQLFIGIVNGESLDNESIAFLHQTSLGNIVYFNWANQLKTVEKISNLSKQIKLTILEHTGIPPLIVIDQEGGVVTRLQKPFAVFPGNMALGATENPQLAFLAGLGMGYELRKCEINTNFAPVVDINDNPLNPIIGVRSYGDQPSKVTEFARNYMKGLHQQGILTTLKHFPGHGNATSDSHLFETVIQKNESELKQTELFPFLKLAKETDLIMTGHIKVPALDPSNCATLSKVIIQKYLREYCQYPGVIVTDCLTMKGVSPNQANFEASVDSITQGAIKAFAAGCDCLLIAGSPLSQKRYYEMMKIIIHQFKEAHLKGVISEKRIDESLKRILTIKLKLNQASQPVKVDSHKIAIEIAQNSLTLASPSLIGQLPANPADNKILIILPEELKQILDFNIDRIFPQSTIFYFEKQALAQSTELLKEIHGADLIFFFSYNAQTSSEQIALMQMLSEKTAKDKIIYIGLKNPYDLLKLKLHKKHLVYLTYNPSATSIQTFLLCLKNKNLPKGTLPFSLSFVDSVK